MRRVLPLLAALAALAVAPAVALGAEVTNSNDSGAGSLRQVAGGGGTITFVPGLGPILLDMPLTIGSAVTITDPEGDVSVGPSGSYSGGALIQFGIGSNGSSVNGVSFTHPGGVGVSVASGLHVAIQRSPIYDVTQPIDLTDSTPVAPASLKVGPRQADGTLPLSGTTSGGGTVDAYDGDPLGTAPTKWLGAGTVSTSGAFSFPLGSDPTAGGKISATLTTGAGSTSEYSATADVPADITSPRILSARALTDKEVVVTPSEPLAVGSVGISDFTLRMAGAPRTIVQGGILPDGRRVYLVSSQAWLPGEAGSVALTKAGALSDPTGNLSSSTTPIPVGASPGDFEPPVLTKLKLKPSKICLTRSRGCTHPGTTISFNASEPGRAVFSIYSSSNRRAGTFVKRLKKAGVQRIKWGGLLHDKKLRAGGYVIEIAVTDSVGNTTDDAPYTKFKVIRSTG